MKHWRVAEIFGPTIQGEGRQAGLPCYFIRFGGCDYRCVWCDTPHAVLPVLVSQLPKMSSEEIIIEVEKLPKGPEWIVISGGNPATLKLDDVVDDLHNLKYKVMVETQGTIWNDWLRKVDELCISPKPPSSTNIVTVQQLDKFLSHWSRQDGHYLKVVVFDEKDYEYARLIHASFPKIPFYLSVGNYDPSLPTVGNPNPGMTTGRQMTRDLICDSFAEMAERVARDRAMANVKLIPQLHVLAWGNVRGR